MHIQLAGKFFIASGLCWELLTFSNISSRAGWEILTFLLAFQAEQKELCELAEGTLKTMTTENEPFHHSLGGDKVVIAG